MKSKLRTISIDGERFNYLISEQFIEHKMEGEKGYFLTKLRIFKDGFKNTPLEIRFHNLDGYAIGNPITNELGGLINLNKPSTVEQLIRGSNTHNNWDWRVKQELIDGISLLKKMNIDTFQLEHQNVPPVNLD